MPASSNVHASHIEWASAMPTVARELLGDPKTRTHGGTVWRYGSQGSLEVNVADGWWRDYEGDDSGGTLALICRERRCDNREAIRWLSEMGLSEDRLVASRQRQPVFYDYQDETGAVLFRVERRKPASPAFLPHGPDGRGGFHSASGCMQGVRRVPYQLPELLSADPRQIVFYTEGEKDADRLTELGFVATTNASGAGKIGPELAQHFAGRRVVALQDNDDAGRRHVEAVVQQLGSVATVAPLLLAGLPPKGDVSDWLDAGGTPADLHALAEKALAGPPEAILPLADLTAWNTSTPNPQRMTMEGFIPECEVTLFTGAGGSNKSTFGQQLATAFAAGLPMLGVPLLSTGGALYVTAEDGWDRLHWMQAHIAKALGVTLAELTGKLEIASLRGRLDNVLGTFDAEGRFHLAPTYLLLKATIKRCGAKLLVLDNVGHLFAGNENDRSQVTAWINALYALCVELGVTVVLIAHPNKAGISYSGSTAWLNAVRSQMVIKRPENAIDPDTRVLSVDKANYARQGAELTFRWHDFALVRDEDLKPEAREELGSVIAAATANERFLECLHARNTQRRTVSHYAAAANYAPRVFAKMPDARGLTIDALEQAMERLMFLGAILGDQQIYQRDTNRTWAKGIGFAQSLAQSLHKAGAQSRTEPHHKAAHIGVPISKDTAPASAAAPISDGSHPTGSDQPC